MMATPGAFIARAGGAIGVRSGGTFPIFNAAGECGECCLEIEFTQKWIFSDVGFIAGGQNGFQRDYEDPDDVPASPWTILNGGLGLRVDFEDDQNCADFNFRTQTVFASAFITVPADTIMTIDWSGMGERQSPNFELMSLSLDGELVGLAHAPGGGLGCAPMGPVVSDPPPPQQVLLTAGVEHRLTIRATTEDGLYHVGAFYQFDLSFEGA